MELTLKRVSRFISVATGINEEKLANCFLPATQDDFENIISLRKSLFPAGVAWNDEAYLKWRYKFDFDSASDDTSGGNYLWIFKKNNEILGYLGVEEVSLFIQGKVHLAYKTMDLFVKPELDGVGLGVWMCLAIRDKYPILFAVGSNKNSHPIVSKIYHQLKNRRTFRLYLSLNAQIERKIKSRVIARILAMPSSFICNLRSRLKNYVDNTRYTIRELDHFPALITDFPTREDQVYINRSIEYLTWRYLQSPRRKFIILGLYEKDILKGISISTIIYSSTNRQNEGVIVDWVINDQDQVSAHLAALYGHTVNHLKARDSKIIHAYTYDKYSSEALLSRGFYERDEVLTLYAYTADQSLAKLLYNDDLWVLTEGDSDTDLF